MQMDRQDLQKIELGNAFESLCDIGKKGEQARNKVIMYTADNEKTNKLFVKCSIRYDDEINSKKPHLGKIKQLQKQLRQAYQIALHGEFVKQGSIMNQIYMETFGVRHGSKEFENAKITLKKLGRKEKEFEYEELL